MKLDRAACLKAAGSKLGSPYGLGYKWKPDNLNPTGPIDCSGFARWCYARGGVQVPDGSWFQHDACEPCSNPLPGDLGFFKSPDGHIDHVGLVYDDANMIEARGAPFNEVILRPRAKWDAWPLFTGYMRLKGLEP